MNCPSCNHTLSDNTVAGMTVQTCEGGCGSLWFDRKQMKKLTERLPSSGQSLLEIPQAEGVRLYRDVDHICPHCTHTLLYRHCFSRKLEFEIDQCARCGGFWVDTGYLARIRKRCKSPEDQRQAAREYFKSLFDDKVANMNMVNHDTLEAAKDIVRLFTFITPPDWLPEKPPL